MEINFWDCEYHDYDEIWNGEDEIRIYMCKHPEGDGVCGLDNKWGEMKDECKLLDQK